MDEEERQRITAMVTEALGEPVDPFTGRSILAELVKYEDPWVVGGTVWRRVLGVNGLGASDFDILLKTPLEVELVRTSFHPKFVELRPDPYTLLSTHGLRIRLPFRTMDVWAPPVGQERNVHVMAFPKVHQRMYVSGRNGLVDLRGGATCTCDTCALRYNSFGTLADLQATPRVWVQASSVATPSTQGTVVQTGRIPYRPDPPRR